MDTDPGIMCFRHCDTSIFYLNSPNSCPICDKNLNQCNIIPFRVPYPFVRAKQIPSAIFIKPANGNFLKNYFVKADLHVGVSNSKGIIFEYDTEGMYFDKADKWNQCLIVYELKDVSWYRRWDFVLEEISGQFNSSAKKYDAENRNCYSFVLEFIKLLNHPDFKGIRKTKEEFCAHFIISRLNEAYKYVILYRKTTPNVVYTISNDADYFKT